MLSSLYPSLPADVESADSVLLCQSGWRVRGCVGGTLSLTLHRFNMCGSGVGVDVEDAAGARANADGSLSFFYWPHTSASRTSRARRVVIFEQSDGFAGGAAATWAPVLSRWALSLPFERHIAIGAGSAGDFRGTLSNILPLAQVRPRRLRVFVNPNAGSGRGERAWARAAPMLADAGIVADVIITRAPGEARDAVASASPFDLLQLEGIIVVGGDGSLSEVVDGMMARRDWAMCALSLALGALPAGSGNGLAVSLCVSAGIPFSADNAAWAVAKGAADPIDIASAFCAVEEEEMRGEIRPTSLTLTHYASGSLGALSLPASSSPCPSSGYFTCESMSAAPTYMSGNDSFTLLSSISGAAKSGSAMASTEGSPIDVAGGSAGGGDVGGGGGGGGGAGAIPIESAMVLHAPIGRAWGIRRWSFLSLEWGLPADLDLESERLRCLGAARFDVYALLRVASLRRYHGRFSYVPAPPAGTASEYGRRSETVTVNAGGDSTPLPELRHLVSFNQRLPATKWKSVEGTFTFLWATNTSHQAIGVSTCSTTHHDSGTWTVALMREPSQCAMLSALLSIDTAGTFANIPGVEILSVVAWRLEPEVAGVIGGTQRTAHTGPGSVALDGERIPYGPVQAEVHEKLLKVYARPRKE